MSELTKEKKIALGVTIAIAVVFVIIIIIVIVVIIKRKKKAEEEKETKEGFKTGNQTIPMILLNSYMISTLTKDARNLSSLVTNSTIYAIERAINKARKELDSAIETFKKRCEEKGIKDHKKVTGPQKTFMQFDKIPVTSRYNRVLDLYEVLRNVISKIEKEKPIITEIVVPEMGWRNHSTSIIKQETKLTIKPEIKTYILNNCNYMEVPTYKYVQASLGQKRKVNGREETIWHESSYNYKPKLEEKVSRSMIQDIDFSGNSHQTNGIKLEESKPVVEEVKISKVEEAKPQVIEEVKVSKVEEVKPIVNEIKIAEAKPEVVELKAVGIAEAKQQVIKAANVEPPVVSNYVEPIRVAESNIIEAKAENPKAETVQAAVVNNYVTSKADGIDFKTASAQNSEVRIPAGAICTTNEQEIKFLKALRSLK